MDQDNIFVTRWRHTPTRKQELVLQLLDKQRMDAMGMAVGAESRGLSKLADEYTLAADTFEAAYKLLEGAS